MIVVDANVFVYASRADAEEHRACREWLERLRSGASPFFSTWPILFEFLRVTTHRRFFRKPSSLEASWRFLRVLAESPSFRILTPSGNFEEIASLSFVELPELSGNILHDAHTAIQMRDAGLRRILTRDTDFHRFPFLEVVDPLREKP